MLRHSLFALGLVALTACGAPADPVEDALEEVAEDITDGLTEDTFTPLPPTAEEVELWSGTWQLRNPDSGEVMIRWELQVEDGRWTGQYTLTEHFCQTQGAPRASACPFEGQGGSWGSITSNIAAMMLKATDPYQTDAVFTLTMFTDSDGNAARAATSADHGFVTVNTDIERAPN
ncbi:MAG: hypothetical protein AAF768_06365 [Pseudomonadota bacterium]